MSIVAEIPGLLQLLSDGSVKRLPLPTTAASDEFTDGYKTKDVVIDPTKPITARIFVPDTGDDDSHRLPVLVHFHGGGFCIGSTAVPPMHAFLGGVCVKSRAVVVSVDYRLAPEHKIPAPHDDCYSSLRWLASNMSEEPWLGRADPSRVFLSGESAGGNIAHHVMLRVARGHGAEGLSIRGLMAIHPYFGSEERIESELAEGMEESLARSDLYWKLSLPEGADRDHWASNFEKTETDTDAKEWQRFPAVTVFVAGMDLLKERGIMYAEFLRSKGLAAVDVVVAHGQQHAFHVFNPDGDAALLLQSQMADFMKKTLQI